MNDTLKAIKARVDAATPGPWASMPDEFVSFLSEQFFMVVGTVKDEDGEVKRITSNRVTLENASFIAHSRTDIEKLLKLVELYEKALKEIVRDDACADFDAQEALALGNELKEGLK